MGLLSGSRALALDTETTGMSPAHGAALVEVASVALDDGVIARTWSSLIHPGQPIPPDAVRVHGITDLMVADAPEPAAVARPLREECADRLLIFHNASFDLPFLADLMRRAGQAPIWNPVVDTLGLARGLFGSGSNTLSALAERLELPSSDQAHRALDDARVTALVFTRLAARWEREYQIRSLAELAAASQDVMRPALRRVPGGAGAVPF